MKKTPVAQVKERFTSKEKLVDAVQKLATDDLWLDRVNANKGLSRVSNDKLLRLHDILSDAKKRFGTRQKLISTILELEQRVKDKGYASRLERYPLPRLVDLHDAKARAKKRGEAAAAKAKAKPKAVAKVGKKAPAKKAAKKAATP
jgi:hypothetical protein